MISFFLLCASHALCALALGSSPVNLAELQSRDLENRETACIAVGDCPSHQDPSSSSSPPPPPPSTSSSNPPPPPSTTNTPQPSSSSSSPPTPSPSAQNVTRYLLFPKTGASKDETDKFEKLLIKVVGVPGEIYESSAIGLGVVFWTAPLTADQAKECASYNLTMGIIPDKIIHRENFASVARQRRRDGKNRIFNNHDRRDTLNRQSDAPDQLKVVSQPDNIPVKNLKNFVYRQEAGQGVTIYIHDSGANKDSNEWKLAPGSKRWIFAGDPNDNRYIINLKEEDDDPTGHGSCIYSMAIGSKYGTAKGANVVIVKYPELADNNPEDSSEAAALDALTKIVNDIRENSLQKRAVVNLSYGFHGGMDDEALTQAKQLIGELLADDVVVITASGNENGKDGRSDIDDYPALFARDFPNLIVVGATDNSGKGAKFSQGGPLLSLSGPGVDIVCAAKTGSSPKIQSGTSFSTGSVSGLAAYFLSLPELQGQLQVPGKTAQNVKDYVLSKARPRIDGEVKVLYNGESSDQN